MTMNNEIPYYKIGRGLRFKKEEMIQFVELFDSQDFNKAV